MLYILDQQIQRHFSVEDLLLDLLDFVVGHRLFQALLLDIAVDLLNLALVVLIFGAQRELGGGLPSG